MKIEIKRDHPLTLLGFISLGLIVSKINEGMSDANLENEALLGVFLLFFVAAYLLQIRQTVLLEPEKIVFVEKKQKIEILFSDIVSVSQKGRRLDIFLRTGKVQIDVGFFSKKNLQTLLSHIGDSVSSQGEKEAEGVTRLS